MQTERRRMQMSSHFFCLAALASPAIMHPPLTSQMSCTCYGASGPGRPHVTITMASCACADDDDDDSTPAELIYSDGRVVVLGDIIRRRLRRSSLESRHDIANLS